ncbi:hypothetical protein [Marilutibacter aestuarii]|uniref:Uncharacterized protein n=1 Tax=Marilutibacter aestuarii TaxID=1706195 RepID=A0A508AZB9_9GAMM|nr:hypothetical protein [Lysobacter aestuarii]TQD51232.1 hypothetical protein FKV25_02030 [Lysobacter aestuarii]
MRNELFATVMSKQVPAASGAVGMVILGVPYGVLIAALLGATLSFYFRKGEPETRIPRVVFGIVAMAFSGAWFSLVLPHIDFLGLGAMAAKVDPSARAGLCALAFQSIWNLGHRFVERKVEAT